MSGERVLTVGGNKASRRLSEFNLTPQDIYAFPAGTYFVDGNVSSTGNGTADHPYSTLAEAIAASNTSIGLAANRWWARRNKIYVCGDQEITENLTVFPEKCDVIGAGFDLDAMPRITGTHIIAAVATGKAYGTRFINCGFMDNAAGPVVHLVTSEMGCAFIGCNFWPLVTGSTHCIQLATGNAKFRMIDCRILLNVGDPTGAGIFAEGVKVSGVAQHDMEFRGNHIHATEGIHIEAGTGGYNGLIDNNVIRAAALTVNDASSLFVLTNNRLITDANPGEDALLGVVANKLLAANNKLTGITTMQNADYPFVNPSTS